MENLLQVGVISSTHGIKGEVKVFPTTDDVKRFKDLKSVIFDFGTLKKEVKIENVKFFKNMAILKFEGYDKIEEVESLRMTKLYVTRENAVKLKKDEYFVCDLIGCIVETDKEILGTISDILHTGANDVYVVKTKNEKEILIPAIKECILKVDMKNKKIKVHLLEGLVTPPVEGDSEE